MTAKRPFPQFDDSAFESPLTLAHSIIAWDEAGRLSSPHGVLIYDPEVDSCYLKGPYPDAYRANEAAVGLNDELNAPENNDGSPVHITVIEVVVP